MRLSRLYHPEKLSFKDVQLVQLTEEKSHYLVNVLRHGIQDEIILFHQAGVEYLAKIHSIEGKKKPLVTVSLHSERLTQTESKLAIHLIQALAKSDKMDWIVQKSVELGVTQIYPVFTEFSELKLNEERALSKQQHWQNIAISAAEQCGRTHVPTIHLPKKIADCLPHVKAETILCLHPHSPAVSFRQAASNLAIPQSLGICIGPEGGFSSKEIDLFKRHAHILMSLGPRILRTETAGIVIQSLLQHQFGDL